VYELGTVTVSEREIIDFAKQYDPQYFHIDPVKAWRVNLAESSLEDFIPSVSQCGSTVSFRQSCMKSIGHSW
jgi:hypothetical protein